MMMKKILFLCCAFSFMINQDLHSQTYCRLHFNSIVADAHNDVIWTLTMKGHDISNRITVGSTDLDRLKEGGVNLQIFSIFCNETYGKGKAFDYANAMIDSLESVVSRNPEKIAFAKNVKQIRKVVKSGKIAALIGVEGGHMIENNPQYLDSLAKRGMKYLTLTWNNSTEWATSAADETSGINLPHKGLTEQGKEIVRKMNSLGVIPDLSHVGEQTFYDVLAITTKPVIVSHSNCHSLASHVRNLTDNQLKAIKANGGVIGINFFSGFIEDDYWKQREIIFEKYKNRVDELSKKYASKGYVARALFKEIPQQEVDKLRPPLTKLIDHVDHIVQVAGIDHVGIGGDFDGAESYAKGLDDVTCYPLITEELLKRGYSKKDIRKILGENILRVLEANEI